MFVEPDMRIAALGHAAACISEAVDAIQATTSVPRDDLRGLPLVAILSSEEYETASSGVC